MQALTRPLLQVFWRGGRVHLCLYSSWPLLRLDQVTPILRRFCEHNTPRIVMTLHALTSFLTIAITLQAHISFIFHLTVPEMLSNGVNLAIGPAAIATSIREATVLARQALKVRK